MKSRVRRHLTFANVASALALCLAAGGGTTAIALSGRGTVDSGDLRNGQVKTQDLARNAATGKKVRESSLSVVPEATHSEDSDRLGGLADTNYQLGNGGTAAFAGAVPVGAAIGEIDFGSVRFRIDCEAADVTLNAQDEAGGTAPTAAAATDVWINGDHDAIVSDGSSTTAVTVAAAESTTPVQIWTADDVVTDAQFNVFLDTAANPDRCVVTMPFSQNLPLAGLTTASAHRSAGRLPTPRAYGLLPR